MTAVTVLFPPFDNVAVLSTTEVRGGARELLEPADVVASADPLDAPEGKMVLTAPPTVLTTVSPSALVVVMTWPAVNEGELGAGDVSNADAESDGTVVAGASAVLVESPGAGADPVSTVDSAFAVVGPIGTGVATLGVELGDGSGVVSDGSGVVGDCSGVVGDDTGLVPLSCRFARWTIEDARPASSRCRTSIAVRSFEKMPSRKLLGDTLCKAECSFESSTSSSNF